MAPAVSWRLLVWNQFAVVPVTVAEMNGLSGSGDEHGVAICPAAPVVAGLAQVVDVGLGQRACGRRTGHLQLQRDDGDVVGRCGNRRLHRVAHPPCDPETSTITAATPITSPSMVSAERSLLARSARNAMNRMSRMITTYPFFSSVGDERRLRVNRSNGHFRPRGCLLRIISYLGRTLALSQKGMPPCALFAFIG